METNKKWHEWLISIGTVVALILAGVTFYYQFLRKPRELTAVVFSTSWDGDRAVTVRVAIWNDGSRDEVLESANVVAEYRGSGKTAGQGRLWGPEVIKPGEAKAFTVSQTLDNPEEFRSFDLAINKKTPDSNGDNVTARVKLILELRTIDNDGDVIVSRAEIGELQINGRKFIGGGFGKNQRLNLLAEKWVGETDVTVVEMK